MKHNSVLVVVTLLLTLLLVMSAGAQDEKTLTVTWAQEPDNLNPMYSTMTFAGYTYQLFLAGAWDYDADYNPHPVLVSEMPSLANGGISEDGTTITLKLNEGMMWSDGDPLDSEDFLFTYEMYMADGNTPQSRSPYDLMISVETPDATTISVSFDTPFAPWLSLFNYVLPEHILRPVYDAEGTLDNASYNFAPEVANGAYVLQEWDSGNFIRFSPNPNYVGGEAIISTLVVTFIPDDEAYVASLRAGDSELGSFIPPSEVAGLEEAGKTVLIIGSGYNEGWFFNTSEERAHPAMTDVNVRKAIAMGFDRFSIIEDLLDGVLPVTSSYWENTPYSSPELEPIPYDPEAAAALLDEAGWVDSNGDGTRDKDGVELVLRYTTNTRQLRQDIQAVAQQQLGEIGVGIEIINYDSNVFWNSYGEGGPSAIGDYDIGEWSSSPDAYPDPHTLSYTCSEIPSDENPVGNNWNYYCDPELDALFEQQMVTTDYDARVAIWHEISKALAEAYIWNGIWYDADVWVISPDLLNTAINGTTPFWNVVEWDKAD
jgi:peptide/nickel transport system substrate-binding protein